MELNILDVLANYLAGERLQNGSQKSQCRSSKGRVYYMEVYGTPMESARTFLVSVVTYWLIRMPV